MEFGSYIIFNRVLLCCYSYFVERQQYGCLPEVMSMVAAEEMTTLPEFVQQCSVVYIPEVGYLLALSLWEENLGFEDLQLEGLEYKVSYSLV
jgi:DNA mismatch repair protein MSH5